LLPHQSSEKRRWKLLKFVTLKSSANEIDLNTHFPTYAIFDGCELGPKRQGIQVQGGTVGQVGATASIQLGMCSVQCRPDQPEAV